MSNTASLHIRRSLVTAITLSALLVASPPIGAQQTTPPATPPVAASGAAPAQTGPTLSLTMDQAVQMALETNLGLQETRLNQAMAAQGIVAARAAFKPVLTSGISRNTATSATQTFTEAATSTTTNSSTSASARWSQALPWFGSSYSVAWSGSRSATNGYTTYNPRLGSTLTLAFNQPLLQGFLIDGNRVGLESAERNREITDLNLQQTILSTEDQVRQAYLNLIASREGLEVARQNRDLSQTALDNALARIKVGSAAEIDAIQSRASVLSSEDQVYQAEAQVARAEDQLREMIVDPSRPDYWQLHIDATDQMDPQPHPIDVDGAIKTALQNRLDLVVARRTIDLQRLSVQLDENLVKPSVGFSAAYSASGTGGTQILTDNNFPPTILSTSTIGFSNVLGDIFTNTNPSWTFGVSVAYPLGQTSAQASLARARISQQQQEIDLKNQELAVVAQVRDAARQVQSGWNRVQSNAAALEASKQQLDAEERKLAVGMSTTFQVLQQQQLLASARIANLNAQIAYAQALLLFEHVQKIR